MSSKYDQYTILSTLDNPPRLLYWEVHDVLVIFIPFVIGMLIKSPIFAFSGLALRPVYKKMKKKFPHGSFLHFLYWNLPTSFVKKYAKVLVRMPSSHIREITLS